MSQWQRLTEMEKREVTNATLVGCMELEELMSDSSATSSDFECAVMTGRAQRGPLRVAPLVLLSTTYAQRASAACQGILARQVRTR